MRPFVPAMIAIICICTSSYSATDEKPLSLMGTLAKWQYPESKFNGAEIADAATMNARGERTSPSTVCKATMTTTDSVEKVIEFYKDLLKRKPKPDGKLDADEDEGISVIFNDDSDGRPFDFQTIIVNATNTSTTIIITRGKDEKETRITWKHYIRHNVGG